MRIARRVGFGVVLVVALGFLMLALPSVRDGVPGQLSQAEQESESATRTGVLAIQLWRENRSTGALAAVQLADASEQVTKAYEEIATLTPDTDGDLRHQQALTATMTEAVAALNGASALVRGVSSPDGVDAVGQRLARAVKDLAGQGES
jgi:biopolymer transport protein ExbD